MAQIGDEIYFHAGGKPTSGKIVCHGKHGATVKDDTGTHHKVKWEGVLGHKTRITPAMNVVDQGVDGAIVEDENGRRGYVHGFQPEAPEEPAPTQSNGFEMLGKALVLFAKAGPLKGKAGLHLEDRTDKTGRHSKHWVKGQEAAPAPRQAAKQEEPAAPKQPAQAEAVKPGQSVAFSVDGESKQGEVVAVGKDGATVKDADGQEHRVYHKELQPAEPKAEDKASSQPSSAEDIARALFNTSEIDKLPKKAVQPVDSWEQLSEKAPEALEQFKGMLEKVAVNLDLVQGKRPQSHHIAVLDEANKAAQENRNVNTVPEEDYMLPDDWDNDKGYLFMGPLKGEKRAREKVEADYDGDWSQVKDMVRATIAVPMVVQIPKVLDELKKAGIELAQQPKNNLVKPLPGGYRDLNLIVKMPNGLLAELQIHIKPMTRAKELGHEHYETKRSLDAKYHGKGLLHQREQWDEGDAGKYDEAMATQEKFYGDAWKQGTGGGKETDAPMTKALTGKTLKVAAGGPMILFATRRT